MRPALTQISLGIRPVSSESSLGAQWVAKDPIFRHVDSEDSDETGLMPWLMWVFPGRTCILLVLSCGGSYVLWFPCFQTSSFQNLFNPYLPSGTVNLYQLEESISNFRGARRFYFFCYINFLYYFLIKLLCAYSADPDQTRLILVYTVCLGPQKGFYANTG